MQHIRVSFPFTDTWLDYPDNESNAILIYMTGCEHNCAGCHNKKFQCSQYDESTARMSADCILEYLRRMSKKYKTDKVVLSGGDPLYCANIDVTRQLLSSDEFEFCVYTGYTADCVRSLNVSGFKFIKCNKYNRDQAQTPSKTDSRMVFASTNQELYDEKYCLLSKSGIYNF